jgi:TRAP-type C4-dicarboxylate transport system permease small subunit
VRLHEQLGEAFALLSEGLRRLESALLTLLLLGLMGLGLVQIVMRNLGTALPWADGVMRSMVLWLAMVAGIMAAGQLRHIRINLIEHWLPTFWLGWINRLAYLIAAAVCGVMSWYGMEMVAIEASFGATAFLTVPVWVVQMIVPIGFALMGLRFGLICLSPRGPRTSPPSGLDAGLEQGDAARPSRP